MVDVMVSIAHVQTSEAATKPPRLYSELDVSLSARRGAAFMNNY